MDLALIERLMRMLEASDLEELDVTEGETRIRLAKHADGGARHEVGDADTATKPVATEISRPTDAVHIVAAGMAGTFYHSSAPEGEPFVAVGDDIREGEQMGIIEAMKTFNPIEADCAGIVRAILVEDGCPVEPGTALFEIDPT